MSFGLDEETRKELADSLGQIVAFFVTNTQEARAERDHWKARAEEAEALVAKYREDGVGKTNLSVVA